MKNPNATTAGSRGRKMPYHILIIDDEPDICKVKKAQLEFDQAFTVTATSDPAKG
jgi:CheY-like chemotaxis protein